MYLPQETLLLVALLLPSFTLATPLSLEISSDSFSKSLHHRRLALPAAYDTSTLNPRSLFFRAFIPSSGAGAAESANSAANAGARAGSSKSNTFNDPSPSPNTNSNTHVGTSTGTHTDNNSDVPGAKKPEEKVDAGKENTSDTKKDDANRGNKDDKTHQPEGEKKKPEDGSNTSTTVGTVPAATGAVSGTAITGVRATASNTQSAAAGPTTTTTGSTTSAAGTTTTAAAVKGAAVGKSTGLGGVLGIITVSFAVATAGLALF